MQFVLLEMQAYQPVSRDLFEELEMLCAFRQSCCMVFRAANGGTASVQSRILGQEVAEDGEYIRLEEGHRIRMDALVSLDGRSLQHWV